MLTDNGHTTMWLSYEDFAVTESRRAVLMRTLSYNYARYDEGRIWMPLGEEDAGISQEERAPHDVFTRSVVRTTIDIIKYCQCYRQLRTS